MPRSSRSTAIGVQVIRHRDDRRVDGRQVVVVRDLRDAADACREVLCALAVGVDEPHVVALDTRRHRRQVEVLRDGAAPDDRQLHDASSVRVERRRLRDHPVETVQPPHPLASRASHRRALLGWRAADRARRRVRRARPAGRAGRSRPRPRSAGRPRPRSPRPASRSPSPPRPRSTCPRSPTRARTRRSPRAARERRPAARAAGTGRRARVQSLAFQQERLGPSPRRRTPGRRARRPGAAPRGLLRRSSPTVPTSGGAVESELRPQAVPVPGTNRSRSSPNGITATERRRSARGLGRDVKMSCGLVASRGASTDAPRHCRRSVPACGT